MIQIQKALLSVSDKTGLEDIALCLQEQKVEILSTGGTLKALQKQGIDSVSIESYTGSPEILGGRVKTLHPKIHGGLLAQRDRELDVQQMKENGIEPIDLLIVNLYPFGETVLQENVSMEKAIENIDIGGPAMIRAAAKNFEHTAVICDPSDYERVQKFIRETGGINRELRMELASKAFSHTASYDSVIADWWNSIRQNNFPNLLTLSFAKEKDLRYGENPHQSAAFYRSLSRSFDSPKGSNRKFTQLQGKELSYNNILDADAALRTILDLPAQGVAIIKHLNPCGASLAVENSGIKEPNFKQAFERARKCDPVSSFGGIISVNGEVQKDLAETIIENFVEIVLASSYTQEALDVFATKKNLRVLSFYKKKVSNQSLEFRNSWDGLLYQETDHILSTPDEWKIVTKKKPDASLLSAMNFAWRLVRQIRSNAIVFTSSHSSLGIGAGQMSRLDSVEIAVSKAKRSGLILQGSATASDAFFPFRDGIDSLARTGASAVVQPGGSVRDHEVIEAADEHGLVMAFTSNRHFLH